MSNLQKKFSYLFADPIFKNYLDLSNHVINNMHKIYNGDLVKSSMIMLLNVLRNYLYYTKPNT